MSTAITINALNVHTERANPSGVCHAEDIAIWILKPSDSHHCSRHGEDAELILLETGINVEHHSALTQIGDSRLDVGNFEAQNRVLMRGEVGNR